MTILVLLHAAGALLFYVLARRQRADRYSAVFLGLLLGPLALPLLLHAYQGRALSGDSSTSAAT